MWPVSYGRFQPLAPSLAAVIHVIEKSVGGEVEWKEKKWARKLGGKAGLSTRPDNVGPQETAEKDFPRCGTGAAPLKRGAAHSNLMCVP